MAALPGSQHQAEVDDRDHAVPGKLIAPGQRIKLAVASDRRKEDDQNHQAHDNDTDDFNDF
jgi:hypothetical protein